MTKVHVAESTFEVADAALQIKAAAGYVCETPESYGFRKIRGGQIAGSTPNIHRSNLAKSLFEEGLPDP